MKEMEGRVRSKILLKYKESNNLKYCIEMCYGLLKSSTNDARKVGDVELAKQYRGEVVETILEMCILDFIKRNPECFYAKSLYLENKNHPGKKTTELDLTLFLPQGIILFESKYRRGKLVLVDECTILVDGRSNFSTDTFSQNILHAKILNYNLGDWLPREKRIFNLCTFLIYEGSLIDKRIKPKIQVIDDTTFDKYISNIKTAEPILNLDVLKEKVTAISLDREKIMRKHLPKSKNSTKKT